MKKILLAQLFMVALITASGQQYSSLVGKDPKFTAKYKLTAVIDEKTMKLNIKTNAPIIELSLDVYTAEQLSVRNGDNYLQKFSKPAGNYSYDLKQPRYKGKFAYWLKVFTKDSLFEEVFFKMKDAPVNTDEVTTGETEEKKNAEGATIISTNIKCVEGKTEVIAALKQLDGVFDVKIDITSGKLTIKYSSDGTPYTTILSTINENGFTADGQKSSSPASNPCPIKKTSN